MILQCQRCGYQWDYKGKAEWYTSCPRCRTSIKVRKREGSGIAGSLKG